jgi:hypothetical protein
MKVNSKHLSKIVLSFALLLAIFNGMVFSYIAQNGSGQGYDEGSGESKLASNNSIEYYVVLGAGYFLKAQVHIQDFLNRVEWQDLTGPDFNELDQLAGSGLDNLRLARENYARLIQIAEKTPYNPEVIDRLKHFSYDIYMKTFNLNPAVFAAVRGYLEKGDITGCFKHFYYRLTMMEMMLMVIQSEISVQRIPTLQLLWKINEVGAETSLFGSFTARVFRAIH